MRLLRLPAVKEKTGKGRSQIYADIANGLFPKPVRPSPKTAAWIDHELDRLIEALARVRDLDLHGTERDDFIRAAIANGEGNHQ